MTGRPQRLVSVGGDDWTLVDAWRSEHGLGLGYFLASEPADDRRAVIEPGRVLDALDDADVAALLESAVPLSPTERRFRDADGDAWLAQSVGPVWGEGAAAGLTGLHLVCLTTERQPVDVSDVRLEDISDDELAALVEPREA